MDEKNRKAFKKMTKDQLIETIDQLNKDCEYWSQRYRETLDRRADTPQPKRPWYGWKFGSVSFDFWPPRDWFRFHWNGWGPGKYAQLCIGPLRIDWADG